MRFARRAGSGLNSVLAGVLFSADQERRGRRQDGQLHGSLRWRAPTVARFVFDARYGIERQFQAFARCGHEVPPRTAELMDLMLQAARSESKEQRAQDECLPKAMRWDNSASDSIDAILEAQRAGRNPPQWAVYGTRRPDADNDGGGGGGGGDDDFTEFRVQSLY